jgi:hypothetical protein
MKKASIILSVLTVMAVITFLVIVMPSLAHNIVLDLITKR